MAREFERTQASMGSNTHTERTHDDTTTQHEGSIAMRAHTTNTQINLSIDRLKDYFTAQQSPKTVATAFGLSVEELHAYTATHGHDMGDLHTKYTARGRIALCVAQFEQALRGNVKMLLFLGKMFPLQDETKEEKTP